MKNIEKIQEEKTITRLSEIEGLLRDEKEPFIIENIDEENLDRIKQIAQSYYPNLSLLPIKDNSQKLLISNYIFVISFLLFHHNFLMLLINFYSHF